MKQLIPGALGTIGVVSVMVLSATLMGGDSTTCVTGSETAADVLFDTRNEALVSYLQRGAADLYSPGWDPASGWGRIDAWGAFVVALGDVNDDRGIDLQDALAVLAHFGESGTAAYNRYDVQYGVAGVDAGVDLADALAVLDNFGLLSCMPLHGGFQTPGVPTWTPTATRTPTPTRTPTS